MCLERIVAQNKRLLSFEFFPPKSTADKTDMYKMMKSLAALSPDFMTVTYGAGGNTKSATFDIVEHIQKDLGIPAVAHLTCISHTISEIDELLDQLTERGIENVLALRGDPPKDGNDLRGNPDNLPNAKELTAFIKNKKKLSVAVAGYPEVHPEAKSENDDLLYLKDKVSEGACTIITQLFFDSSMYFRFVERAKNAGIDVPIIPGIMPIANAKQTKRFTKMCGASIPKEISDKLEEIGDDPKKVKEFGTSYAIKQCTELLNGGAPGVHLYTLNKSTQVEQVVNAIKPLYS